MVSKEQALKNYITLNMFLIKSYDELKDKIYSTPCLNYKDSCFFEENEPFKIILQWNMFYRKNIYFFYKNKIKNDIDIINSFIKKNKIDTNIFEKDLDFLRNKCEEYFLLYENIVFVEDCSKLNIKETVCETLDIFNDFKNINYQVKQLVNKLDFDFKKRFYQFKIFKNLSENVIYNHPDIYFSTKIKTSIRNFIFDLIEE